MTCAACGQDNREGRKFCAACGARLAAGCPACGTPSEPGEKFCGECGGQLQGAGSRAQDSGDSKRTLIPDRVAPNPLASAGARKVVTIIFADLVGSTALHERLDAEAVRQFMAGYYAAMRGAVEAHGGRVTQLMGDGVKAVFGAPRVAEDDAIRAVRAAVEMQRAFRALAEQQQGRVGKTGLRVAVNTGEVVTEEGQEIIGDPVNVAARLQERGRDGDVVIGGSTQRLVAPLVTLDRLGSFALKGRTEEVEAYRVVSLEPPPGAVTSAFVGRDEELARLAAVYQGAIAKPASKLAVLVASPGLGKSRLISEFAQRLGDAATVLSAHCDAASGASFAPLAEALRELFGQATSPEPARGVALGYDPAGLSGLSSEQSAKGEDPQQGGQAVARGNAPGYGDLAGDLRRSIEALLRGNDPERSRIVAGITALLAGSPASPEETFFVVRRLLAALATAKPVVLVIDDLHWAEPLLLDLVEHLVQWGSGVPLLVLVGARPELRDLRSSLVTPGGLVADVVTLGGLDAGAAMRLAANVIGAADLPAAVAAKVLATSEGNPLFVTELVRMLVQEGALTKEGKRWTIGAKLTALEMPPTIHALLAGRIERLRPEESFVLERAAVVGRHFSRSAIAALLPGEVVDLDGRLEALRRSELIERDTGWLLGEPVLRFHHVLIRDAAYRRLLKGTRVELHRRLADWIEARVGDAPEHDETIGWHLEQAHQHLRELGPLDENGRSLGERAARHLAAAGRRALARDDVSLAASLLGRAIERVDTGDPTRAELALDWCEALLSAGDVGLAAKAIEGLGRYAGTGASDRQKGRLRAWHTCFAGQLTVMIAPQQLQATADAVAGAAEEFAQLGDAAGEAKAHSVHAQALARLGRVGACEAALDRALAAARRAGDRRRANAVLAGAPLAALGGPSPVTRASGRCLDVVRVLRITQGAPAVEAVALSCQGVLEALRGRIDAARRMVASSRKMVEELGIAHRLFEADVFAGRIDLLECDAEAAERKLRGAYDGLRDLGLGIDAARAGAMLARALLLQGEVAEAERLTHESEQLAGDDLQAAIAWRGVRAEALARRGEHGAAIELAQAAVTIAAATDALLDHADARLALAAALRAAGRGGEADAEEHRAIALWEAKGATLLAESARREARVAPVGGTLLPPVDPAPGVRRRVVPNAATAMQARFDAILAARDFDEIGSIFSESFLEIDHPTGASYGSDESLSSLQRLFRSRDPRYDLEAMATLGPSLLLVRRRSRASGATSGRYDVGEYENEAIQLLEVDERGRLCRSEVFGADHLGDAIARLYERYAERCPDDPSPGGFGSHAVPARKRAVTTARAVAAMLTRSTEHRLEDVMVPELQAVDHRTIGPLQGPDLPSRWRAASDELTQDQTFRVDDVLALSVDGLLRRTTQSGKVRASGGAFETSSWALSVFGSDGRQTRFEIFGVGHEGEALARFDELTGARPPAVRRVRENTVTAGIARFDELVAARDADALADMLSERFELVHHSTATTYGRRGMLTTWRSLFGAERLAFRHEVLATLGDSLALHRHLVSAEGFAEEHLRSAGPIELEEICLTEVDEKGVVLRFELFASDRLGEGVARLYERYAELLSPSPERDCIAETARSVARMTGILEHDRMASAIVPEVDVVDHRLLGTWSARGADSLLRHVDSWLVLGDEHTGRENDVLALRPDSLLLKRTFSGTDRASGGVFDGELLVLWRFGSDGRLIRWEMFDVDREAEALARFEELVGSDAPFARLRLPRGDHRGVEPPPDPLLGNEGEPVLGAVPRFANAATRFNERFLQAWTEGNWDAVTALHGPAHQLDDRRRLMQMQVPVDTSMAQLRVLFEVPGSRWTITPLATRGERLALSRILFEGDVEAGGGTLAIEYLAVDEVDGDGRSIAVVFFDPDDLDAAWAELDARWKAGDFLLFLTASAGDRGRDSLALIARPNTATAAIHRWQETFETAFETGDWDPMRAICAPGLLFDDRRRLALLSGDRELMITSARVRVEMGARPQIRLMGTAGDRIAAVQVLWSGGPSEGPFEIEYVGLFEVDETGQHTAMVLFDADDARAAQREAWARWAAIDPTVSEVTAALGEVIDGWNTKDPERLRAAFAEDIVVEDHRHTGTGRSEGREAYLQSVIALWELAPESRFEAGWFWLAIAPNAGVYTARRSGTLPGGGAFESDFLVVARVERGCTMRLEIFEIDDVDAAIACFEELTCCVVGRPPSAVGPPPRPLVRKEGEQAGKPPPESLRIPPNAASVAVERVTSYADAANWDALNALCEKMVFEDRRRLFLTSGDGEQFLTNSRFVWESGARPNYTPLATAGDRLLLQHNLWREVREGEVVSETETLEVFEADEDGRVIAAIIFEADDHIAARTELFERYAAGGADGASPETLDIIRAWNDHDLDRLRALLPDDFYLHDRKRTGVGRIEGADAYVASIAALYELSHDVRIDTLYNVSIAEHGRVYVARWTGTNAEGGDFDAVYVCLGVLEGDRPSGLEIFELDDLDAAVARFEELRVARKERQEPAPPR